MTQYKNLVIWSHIDSLPEATTNPDLQLPIYREYLESHTPYDDHLVTLLLLYGGSLNDDANGDSTVGSLEIGRQDHITIAQQYNMPVIAGIEYGKPEILTLV